ncbi:MAG: hypothetical protein ACFB0G_23390, partial [Leptolyngbyaceae cyanobacterium]
DLFTMPFERRYCHFRLNVQIRLKGIETSFLNNFHCQCHHPGHNDQIPRKGIETYFIYNLAQELASQRPNSPQGD